MLSYYKETTEETCRNLSDKGIEVIPFKNPTVYEKLKTKEEQQRALQQAENYYKWTLPLIKKLKMSQTVNDFSQELRNNDLALDAALSCAFQGFGWDYSIFPKLVEEGDIIDAYTLDFRQIYCNENFFKGTSYTLDQLQAYSFLIYINVQAK
ncbi:MAG: hypothetical protein KDD58_08935 [Bdellovibrionales bacterium]|nr:hypothetical protein [Bdellovibrionales bacterium]